MCRQLFDPETTETAQTTTNKQQKNKIQRNIKFKMLIRQFEIITKHLIAMRIGRHDEKNIFYLRVYLCGIFYWIFFHRR